MAAGEGGWLSEKGGEIKKNQTKNKQTTKNTTKPPKYLIQQYGDYQRRKGVDERKGKETISGDGRKLDLG